MSHVSSSRRNKTGQSLLLSALVLSALHNYLFMFQNIGLNYGLFFIPLSAFILSFSILRKGTSYFRTGLAGLGLIFACFTLVNASSILIFFNVIVSLGLLALIIISSVTGGLRRMNIVSLVVEYFKLPFHALAALLNERLIDTKTLKQYHFSEKSRAVLRGIVITLPIVLVFGLLFSAADSVFADLFSFDWLGFEISPELVGRLFVMLVVGTGLIAIGKHLAFAKGEHLSKIAVSSSKQARTEVSILLSALNGLFLIFIAIQVVYLFGGRSVVFDQGLTYADYARRGFFELVIVASLSYLVVSISDRFTKKDNLNNYFTKILQLALIAQVFVIIASALKRLKLYQDAFGLTTSRFYAYVLMLGIAAAFLLLVWKILSNKSESWLLPKYGLIILSALLLLNFIVPDRYVARHNVDRFIRTGKLDAQYLGSLSADAAAEQQRALQILGSGYKGVEDSSEEMLREVCNLPSYLAQVAEHDWRSFTIAKDNHERLVRNSKECREQRQA